MEQSARSTEGLNRYCVVCGKEWGPTFQECCTPASLIATKREGVLGKTQVFLALDGTRLDEQRLSDLRRIETEAHKELLARPRVAPVRAPAADYAKLRKEFGREQKPDVPAIRVRCRTCSDAINWAQTGCSRCRTEVCSGIPRSLDSVLVLLVRSIVGLAAYALVSGATAGNGSGTPNNLPIFAAALTIFLLPVFNIYPMRARFKLISGPPGAGFPLTEEDQARVWETATENWRVPNATAEHVLSSLIPRDAASQLATRWEARERRQQKGATKEH